MELHKLSVSDIQGLDSKARRDAEKDIRKQLGTARMDVYKTLGVKSHTVRGLKKSLARLLTVGGQQEVDSAQAGKVSNAKNVK